MQPREVALAVDEGPWRVHVGLPFRFRDPAPVEGFVSDGDPDVAFFVARNPGYLEGHWLASYVPLEPRHLLASAIPWLQRWIGNRAG